MRALCSFCGDQHYAPDSAGLRGVERGGRLPFTLRGKEPNRGARSRAPCKRAWPPPLTPCTDTRRPGTRAPRPCRRGAASRWAGAPTGHCASGGPSKPRQPPRLAPAHPTSRGRTQTPERASGSQTTGGGQGATGACRPLTRASEARVPPAEYLWGTGGHETKLERPSRPDGPRTRPEACSVDRPDARRPAQCAYP